MTLSISPMRKMSSAAAELEMQQALNCWREGKIELLATLQCKRGLRGRIELLVTLKGKRKLQKRILLLGVLTEKKG